MENLIVECNQEISEESTIKTELGYINTVVLTSPALNSTAAKCY